MAKRFLRDTAELCFPSLRSDQLDWEDVTRRLNLGEKEDLLEELHLAGHVRGVEPFPDEDQAANDVADASLPLLAVNNARVLDSRGGQPKEVIVIAEDDSALAQAERELVLVGGPEEAHLGRGRHVDPAAAKARGNGVRAVLIKMESNRPRHWPSVP